MVCLDLYEGSSRLCIICEFFFFFFAFLRESAVLNAFSTSVYSEYSSGPSLGQVVHCVYNSTLISQDDEIWVKF